MMHLAPWDDAAFAAMGRATSPFGALANIREMMRGADLYLYQDKLQRAFLAVRQIDLAGGRRLDIVGVSSVGNRLDSRKFHGAIDGLALDYQAQLLACCTSVPHVARSCTAHGFAITGAVMTKKTGLENHGQ